MVHTSGSVCPSGERIESLNNTLFPDSSTPSKRPRYTTQSSAFSGLPFLSPIRVADRTRGNVPSNAASINYEPGYQNRTCVDPEDQNRTCVDPSISCPIASSPSSNSTVKDVQMQ